MITAYISYRNGDFKAFDFPTLTSALETVRQTLEVGDVFFIKEGTTVLAKGRIEDYKGSYDE